jgi:hypothetical protein
MPVDELTNHGFGGGHLHLLLHVDISAIAVTSGCHVAERTNAFGDGVERFPGLLVLLLADRVGRGTRVR